jgi:hypothetical protein
MAKLWASEMAQALAAMAMGVHGERGALAAAPVERLYRDAPLMIIGEGTNEIQRTLIARQLVARYGERPGALATREGEPDERRRLAMAVRQIVDKEIGPVVAGLEAGGHYPADLVHALADFGLLGALVPVARGGLGLDLTTYAMIIEELARGWTTIASIVAAHATASWAVRRLAQPAAGPLLPRLARGEDLATVALSGRVTARLEQEGWSVSGTTDLVDNGARAGLFVVRASPESGPPLLAVVERTAPGLTRQPPQPTLGGRGVDPVQLVFDGVRVAPPWTLDDGDALGGLARLGLAATAVGLAQAAFEASLRYAQQRSAFGQPICHHQAIQLKLADMATSLAAARLLTYHAAERLEAGDDLPAGLARLLAAETAGAVALEAMRIHGGYGYTTEFPVERYYRDAPRLLLALGGPEVERAGLARRLVERRSA